jgi:hypothetical protein
MINKKIIMFSIGILLVLTLFTGVSAFSYDEDDDGNPFYEADAEIRVPAISIRDLFILQPSSEPVEPELGTIYFDVNSKRLKLYDGTGWYSIVLEKDYFEEEIEEEIEDVEEVKEQAEKGDEKKDKEKKEESEKESDGEEEKEIEEDDTESIRKKAEVEETCIASTTCGEWGDCINDHQTKVCVSVNEDCSESRVTETQDCITENPFHKEIEEEEIEEEIGDVEEVKEQAEKGDEKKDKEKKEEIEEDDKEITINLEYKTGTNYDADDDGNESTIGIIDLTVENTRFNWDVDEIKLCTRWETRSLETNESTTVCHGSEQCCVFMELTPARDKWNNIFYLNYGKYGATYNNIVSARIIYYDVSLDLNNIYSNVYNSDWANLEVKFYSEPIPEELFDITFDIEENTLSSSDKLVVLITLQNFGRKHVPARLIYIFEDKDGNEVYRDFEEIRVYTDESIIKRFDELKLKQGKYKLKLNVEYAGIVEEFESGFEIKENVLVRIKNWFDVLFGGKG